MSTITIEHKTLGRVQLNPRRQYHFLMGTTPVTKVFVGEDYYNHLATLDKYVGSDTRIALQHASHTRAKKLLVTCPNCHGTGDKLRERGNHSSLGRVTKCYTCMGEGEVVIDNPKYLKFVDHMLSALGR